MSTVLLIALFLLAVVALVIWLEVRKSRPGRRSRSRQNPSIFVDMDDQPPTEIDFEAGIRANRNPRASHAD